MAVPEIMCTLTPAQVYDNPGLVRHMHAAGMQSVRLNTAHFDTVQQLGAVAHSLKTLCPGIRILIDTKGPEMRTTHAVGRLTPGMCVTVCGVDAADDTHPQCATDIHVNFPYIHRYVRPANRLLIDDARIILDVTDVDGTVIHATVSQGGVLDARKGFAVQGVDVDLPPVSDRDRAFIAFASSCADIDVVAHSFVRSADDVVAVRAAMTTATKPIIAKIENQQGIDNLPAILAVADGILIARGDLTASIGPSNIPAAQSLIAATTKAFYPDSTPTCSRRLSTPSPISATNHPDPVPKPSPISTTKVYHPDPAPTPSPVSTTEITNVRLLYLATNILPSLMISPTPSDADIHGIHTALTQRVDVLLLTNETASGPHPLQSVLTLHHLITTHL